MVQGMVSGATNYAMQSLEDILLDIKKWINYTSSLRTLLSELYTQSQNTNYWRRVHYDFKQVIYDSIIYFDRIIYDFKIIEKSIENDCINKCEVELLKNIGTNAKELNRRYIYTFNADWFHDYDNKEYKIVERMYEEGCDFFATLIDAVNAAKRLEDYMKESDNINVNIGGNIDNSQVQIGTTNSNQSMVINNNNSFDYSSLLKLLSEINNNSLMIKEELGTSKDAFFDKLDEIQTMIQKNEKPSIIKEALNKLMDIATGVGAKLTSSLLKNKLTTFLK
ncbi:MAG: hypothetical protein PUD31_05845 [Solobacterium sp.]|nr:hypothetical protein [Solobacterium sp.]